MTWPRACRLAAVAVVGVASGVAVDGFLATPARAEEAGGPAAAEPAPGPTSALPAILHDIGIDQRLGERVPLDVELRDETGRTVRLGDYLRDRPVVLAPVYYECPMLCTLTLNGLTGALATMSLEAGEDFHVVAFSIDPGETPALAAAKKEAYVRRYRRDGAERGWHFLTAEQASIERLTEAIGFRYAYDAERDEYAHAAGVMVLTPDGVLARYFYGVEPSPRDLRLGLVEASAGTIGSPVDQLLLFCYSYDPATGKYGAVVMNIVRLGGAATVLFLVVLFIVLRRRERRRASALAAEGAACSSG